MSEIEVDKREMTVERLKVVRAQLHATGATVLSPTAEWTVLRKEMLELQRKLK